MDAAKGLKKKIKKSRALLGKINPGGAPDMDAAAGTPDMDATAVASDMDAAAETPDMDAEAVARGIE